MNRNEKRRQKKLAEKAKNKMPREHVIDKQQSQGMSIQQAISLGLRHHNAGDLGKAETIYKQILHADTKHPVALHLLGVIAHQSGQNDTAVDLIGKALTFNPRYAEAYSNLGIALLEQGKLEEAVDAYRKALSLKPDYAEAYCNLGLALHQQNRLAEAIESYHKALDIKPDYVEAHSNLGLTLRKQGNREEAIICFKQALAIRPNFAKAHNSLGSILQEQGKLEEAVTCYRKALTINPDYAEAHNNLGLAYQKQGHLEDAIKSYTKSLRIHPGLAEAHNNMGAVFVKQGDTNRALLCFQKAIASKPSYAEAYNNLGLALQKQGNLDEALLNYEKALSMRPDKDGWRIRMSLAQPIIMLSAEDIKTKRARLSGILENLMDRPFSVGDPFDDIGVTNFHTAYHNQNNKDLHESIARLHLHACPDLAYTADHCRRDHCRKEGRLKVGVLSAYLHNHTIGKLFKGIIEKFSKNRFEIILIQPAQETDEISDAISKAADKTVLLQYNLEIDRKTIASEELDILFYPDIGMAAYTYFLAFARLAPVQIVSWGHPDTTGIPNIDYFLSSDLIEPEGSNSHYSERLAKISLMPTYYFPPSPPDKKFYRADFGLPETGALYICPQSLFKLHPDFDQVIAELLLKDEKGHLVLIRDGHGGGLSKLIIQRLKTTSSEITKRIVFVPRMTRHEFFGLTMLADAMLDVPSFSGGNTSLEAFTMGVPIVTWPGKFMRGRVTAGYYAQMGLNDLVVSDAESYISLALRLAHDRDFRIKIEADIKSNSHKLFRRMEVVRELENFFVATHQLAAKTSARKLTE